MKIYDIPVCEKCNEEKAMTRWMQTWLCGRCLEKADKMMKQKHREMFLTE